jgi:hypothetical protein
VLDTPEPSKIKKNEEVQDLDSTSMTIVEIKEEDQVMEQVYQLAESIQ